MAQLPTSHGDVNPKHRKALSLPSLILRGDLDAEAFAGTDFSIECGTGVPTHALPGSVRRGVWLRTDGSIVATVYATVNAGTNWTALALP